MANDITQDGSGFFGVEVHAVRIGDSPPAVRFELVVAPDDWSRQVRSRTTVAESETANRYLAWWTEFLPAFHERFPGWSNATTPTTKSWTNFPAGRSTMSYGLSFAYPAGASNYSLRTEVYLQDGETLPHFSDHAEAIEADCGFPLHWESREGTRAARIATYLDPANPADVDRWEDYRQWSFERLGTLRRVLQPYIDSAPL